MYAANDNQAEAMSSAPVDVLPPEFRKMLDQCDRVGISMDLLMSIIRARLLEAGFDRTHGTEQALTALRRVIERHR
jgi:hypothetical protein